MEYLNDKEFNFVLHHSNLPNDEIALYLKKKPKTIAQAKKDLGIKNEKCRDWTNEEIEFLKKNYGKMRVSELIPVLHRSRASITGKANRLGLHANLPEVPHGRKWSDDEIEYLIAHQHDSYNDIATHLNRNPSSITNKLFTLGLRKRNRKGWTQKEEEYLYNNLSAKSYAEIGKTLHRSPEAVRNYAIRKQYRKFEGILTLSELSRIFDLDLHYIRRYWIDKHSMPVQKRSIGGRMYYSINPDRFWEWVSEHRNIISLQKYEQGSIMPEPANLSELMDTTRKVAKNHHRPMTTKERERICYEHNTNGLSIKSLARKYGRSENAIAHISSNKARIPRL